MGLDGSGTDQQWKNLQDQQLRGLLQMLSPSHPVVELRLSFILLISYQKHNGSLSFYICSSLQPEWCLSYRMCKNAQLLQSPSPSEVRHSSQTRRLVFVFWHFLYFWSIAEGLGGTKMRTRSNPSKGGYDETLLLPVSGDVQSVPIWMGQSKPISAAYAPSGLCTHRAPTWLSSLSCLWF